MLLYTHSFSRETFFYLARRRRLRATPIFAYCSDHCKKKNGIEEPNVFVNPFRVEHDLNPYIKPYRQYRSAFLYPEITPSLSQHPLHPILITSEANQSLSSTVSQGVDHATTVPSPSPQPHQIAAAPTPADTAPQDSASSIEADVAEDPITPLSKGSSPVTHT